MIRIFSAPLLKGHPLTPLHTVEVEHTTRTDVGVTDISTHTHMAFEAICREEDEPQYRKLLVNQLEKASRHWERHYEDIASALSL